MKSLWVNRIALAFALSMLAAAPLSAATSALEAMGAGTFETNCFNTLSSGCTATSTGSMTGTTVQAGQFTLRFDTGSPSSFNVNQGICLPATGRGRLTETGGDTIEFTHAGLVCEEAAASSPFLYHATIRVTGGTGRFASATGTGVVAVSHVREGTFTRGTGTAAFFLRGTVTY